MSYTDSHAHLGDARFQQDLGSVLQEARSAGVERILTVALGHTVEDMLGTIAIARSNPNVWAAVGIHPHDASHASDSLLTEIAELTKEKEVIAWGEIGLDFYYDNSPRDIQLKVFRDQLTRARERELPVIIHCRDAWSECLQVLEEEWSGSALGGILHCFTGTEADAARALKLGLLVSFSGIVTFPKSDGLRSAARLVPLDRTLIETDCPYLAPQKHRGKRNQPAYVVEVARQLAQIHGRSVEEIGEATAGNFDRLFPRTSRI